MWSSSQLSHEIKSINSSCWFLLTLNSLVYDKCIPILLMTIQKETENFFFTMAPNNQCGNVIVEDDFNFFFLCLLHSDMTNVSELMQTKIRMRTFFLLLVSFCFLLSIAVCDRFLSVIELQSYEESSMEDRSVNRYQRDNSSEQWNFH